MRLVNIHDQQAQAGQGSDPCEKASILANEPEVCPTQYV